jgi:outer membrane protein assembly factor BamB
VASKRSSDGLRLWPAWLILIGATAILVAIWAPADSPVSMSKPTVTVITPIFTTLLLLLWWLLLSRARWWARLAVLALVVGLGWGARRFVEIRGFSGNLVPQIAWQGAVAPAPELPEATPSPTPTAAAPSPAPPDAGEAVPSEEEKPESESPATGEEAATAEPPGEAPSDPPSPSFPQFLGPDRNAVLRGVHLAPAWDDRPPTELWRRPIGAGWAGFAVADGIAVTQEQREGQGVVVAYDLETGAVRWSHAAGGGFRSTLAGDGPRATPTLHEGRVYAFGVDGVLRALDLTTGGLLFERDVLEENAARAPMHGLSSSPLVTDGLVIVLAGGGNGRSLVAYDAETGVSRWAGGDDEAAYSSPLVATLGGRRQIVVLNLRHLTGHDPTTGEVLWKDRWPDRPEKVSQPVVLEGDRVFASMGYGVGARLVQVARRPDGGFEADLQWESRRLKAKFTQVVEHEGFLYGLDEGVLVCLDPANGERRWKRGRYGHGQVLLVDDLLLLQAEDGRVLLIDPNPEELTEVASFQAVGGKTWATPALAGDLLIVRSEFEAACFRLPTEPGA